MRNFRDFVALMLVAVIASSTGGCASLSVYADNKHAAAERDLYIGPSAESLAGHERVTIISGYIPFEVDMANYDPHIVAWPAEAVDIDGKRPSIPLTALRLDIADQAMYDEVMEDYRPTWTIISVLPRETFNGLSIVIKGHCADYLYNVAGEGYELKTSLTGNIKWEKIKQHFPAVTPDAPFIDEIDSGSPTFQEIHARLSAFALATFNNQFSTIEKKELDETVSKSKGAIRFLEWLTKDLRFLVTVPVGPTAGMAIQPLMTKVVELPNFFSKKLKLANCLESPATLEKSARIVERYHRQKIAPLKREVRMLRSILQEAMK